MELQKRRGQAGQHPLRSASDGLPNLVGATCVAPAMRTSMHGILPCSITRKSSQYEQPNHTASGLVPCRQTPPFSLQFDSTFFASCKSSIFFDFFNFSTFLLQTFPLSPFLTFYLIGHRSSRDTLYPMHRSTYSQVPLCSLSPYIAVAQSRLPEKKSWQSWNTCSTNNPSTWQCGLYRI